MSGEDAANPVNPSPGYFSTARTFVGHAKSDGRIRVVPGRPRRLESTPATEKKRTYNNLRYAERKRLLDDHKLSGGCKDCGYRGHPAALHFDHGGNKLFGIATNLSRKWIDLPVELNKCEIRCANCHAIKHSKIPT